MPTLAEMIDAIRAHGKSLEDIASSLGVSAQAVYSWQSGKVKNPRREARQGLEDLYSSTIGTATGSQVPQTAPSIPSSDETTRASAKASGRSIPVNEATLFEASPLPERHGAPPPRSQGERFRFIHCADLHIDSPLTGIRKIDPRNAPWIELASRRAFTRLVDMAIDDNVDFVVIAGDLFDGEWKSADTGIFVSRQLARLTAASIPVFAVAGNHDAASVVTRSVRWPENAHLLGTAPESIVLNDLGVVIHGRSFGDRYVESDFVQSYPPAHPGLFNIGILHTSLGGDSRHPTYAPCSPAQLAARGYDYWALGHVHIPRVVQTNPHIVYSGNIQGRDIGETGPRGCFVVTVDGDRRLATHFVPLDDVRWEAIEMSIEEMEADAVDEVVAEVVGRLEDSLPADNRLLACRVVLTGATPLHRRLLSRRGSLRDEVTTVSGSQFEGRVCLEKIVVKTTAPDALPPANDTVPQRAITMLDEEFRRLREIGSDELLAGEADLRKLFDSLVVLNSMRPGQRDSLQAADTWLAFIDDARALLDAELGSTASDGDDSP